MKIISNLFNCNGFLIIELLIALALIAALSIGLGAYQLKLRLYQKATMQFYTAINHAENQIEAIFAKAQLPVNSVVYQKEFKIDTIVQNGPASAFYQVEITVFWRSALGYDQQIKFETICL